MVICKYKWTSTFSAMYKQTYVFGGIEMKNKDKDTYELKKFITIYSLIKLNHYMDNRIREFGIFAKGKRHFESKFNLIKSWKTEVKDKVLSEISLHIEIDKVEMCKLETLKKRIDRYYEYFEVIDNEENEENEKYEELFDTLIQVPAEIYNSLDIKSSRKQATFISNDYEVEKFASKGLTENESFCYAA